jgi:hypothetical protein
MPKDRRNGYDRRIFSYTTHIPERRSGSDRRRFHKIVTDKKYNISRELPRPNLFYEPGERT